MFKYIWPKIDFIDKNQCELILKDNGVGLGSPEKLINHNLGWEIVNSLTRQLDGKIEILNCETGTGFKLICPTTYNEEGD